jgi:dTDP-4-dehydrorhamnose 3,5-epimerase
MARTPPVGWKVTGDPDPQTVDAQWRMVDEPSIDGVTVTEIRPVPTSTGFLTEIFRDSWGLDNLDVRSVFQRTLHPGGLTGWHAHAVTTDRLFCSVGSVEVALFDGRESSPTVDALWRRVIAETRPALLVIPPGVWHAVKNVAPETAVLLNLVDHAYSYEEPDHWRLPIANDVIPYDPRD